ncbi:2-phosphosulfolactate phosphatase [mine drainage metagenome]|uniref:2-phosphosulfolactate phosphatase n=1 Tax=mine drainage metagenome TaxID=410659 RepID=T1A6J2_9ZZZZ
MKVSIVEGRKTTNFPTCTKVLVDIYRSTTTIPVAIKSGAKYVIPAMTVSEAISVSKEIQNSITIGERYGIKLPRFDLNNSPHDVSKF